MRTIAEVHKVWMRKGVWASVLLASALTLSASPAAAQGRPLPGPNQAFLYEMDEIAVVLNTAGHVLVPGQSPTGLVSSVTGEVGIPAVRHATSQLQGWARLGSLLCPIPAEVTIGTQECTVIATGTDDVQLLIDPQTGKVTPTSGAVSGTYAVVVQLDNGVDSPELPVQTGTFSGVINFRDGVPLGFVSGGTFTIDGVPGTYPFDAVFRQPFNDSAKAEAVTGRGRAVKAERSNMNAREQAAYYLLDDGSWQQLRDDERAVGWPTVRFEITF
jgi:hypothetical protein